MDSDFEPLFGGETYDEARDGGRLFAQLRDVFNLMQDGQWRTLPEISERLGHPPASVSARLRDFRKDRFGGFTVERQYLRRGLFTYRLHTDLRSIESYFFDV